VVAPISPSQRGDQANLTKNQLPPANIIRVKWLCKDFLAANLNNNSKERPSSFGPEFKVFANN
jgi:hypothetical protein